MMNSDNTQYGTGDASYQAAGEYAGIEQLVDCFFNLMEQLPAASKIRGMHPQDLTESRQKLTLFLCGWLGGPKLYQEKYGPIRIPMAHMHLDIGELERDAWLQCMQQAADKQPYPEAFRCYLLSQLFIPAERVREVATKQRAPRQKNDA
jgi:hemoglobin